MKNGNNAEQSNVLAVRERERWREDKETPFSERACRVTQMHTPNINAKPLLQLLLGSELVRVATLLLAAVSGTRGQTGITLAANHLIAVVF